MRRHLYPVPVLAAVVLTGCAGGMNVENTQARSLGTDFGNAVRHNFAVQTVDPMPIQPDNAAPPLDGKRAAAAIERYQNGAVRELEIESTSGGPTD